jgi:hypothetical protein
MGAKLPIIIQNGKAHFRLSDIKMPRKIVVAGAISALMARNRPEFAKFAMFAISVSRN